MHHHTYWTEILTVRICSTVQCISPQERKISVPILSRSAFPRSCTKFVFPRARVFLKRQERRNARPSLLTLLFIFYTMHLKTFLNSFLFCFFLHFGVKNLEDLTSYSLHISTFSPILKNIY